MLSCFLVLPKIQANNAGAADALMLDLEGFVSETNATNVFMVKNGVVHTPTGDSCLPGRWLCRFHGVILTSLLFLRNNTKDCYGDLSTSSDPLKGAQNFPRGIPCRRRSVHDGNHGRAHASE